jgi:hypothetical protein
LPSLKSPGGCFSSGFAAFDAALEQFATFVAHECAGPAGAYLSFLSQSAFFFPELCGLIHRDIKPANKICGAQRVFRSSPRNAWYQGTA